MIFLPVVARELRVAARRKGTYRTRMWAVLIATLVFGWNLLDFIKSHTAASAQGRPIFMALSGFAFLYCLFIGSRITADCLSEEKREGTLGLLFLTDLKGYDIIFGKLAATSMNAAYGLMAIIPLLALPMQIGGVTILQFGRMAVLLLNTLFFSLAVGIFVSAISRDERKAMFATVLGVLVVVFMPLVAAFMLASYFPHVFERSPENLWPVLCLSPAYAFEWILLSSSPFPFPFGPSSFWVSLAITHLLSWFLLYKASRILPRIWQSESPRGRLARWQEKIEQWGYGSAGKRKSFRARLLDINAFLWLASRDRWKPRYVWLLVAAVAGMWVWSYMKYERMMFDIDTLVPSVFILNTFLKIWVASEACARLVADRRAGALELLLSTPLSTREIIQGQWLALRRQFARPVLLLILMEYWAVRHTVDRLPVLAGLSMLILDMLTLGWVSLWLGLRAKNTGRAILIAVTLVLIVPWGLYTLAKIILDILLGFTGPPGNSIEFNAKVYLWFAIGLIIDVSLGFLWARRRVIRDFRDQAMQRYRSATAHETGG